MGKWISNPNGPLAKREVKPLPKPDKIKKEGQKRSEIKAKKSDPELSEQERLLMAKVFMRDRGKCHLCGISVPIGTIPHHIIPKGPGGRSALKKLIDSIHLRVLLCLECHEGVHFKEGAINPYVFYQKALLIGYHERVILLEILINEWAGWIPPENANLAEQIRKRNQERWSTVLGTTVPITSKVIGLMWEKVLEMEMERYGYHRTIPNCHG